MTEDPRTIAARADAQRRFVVQRGVPTPERSVRQIIPTTAASEVLLRIAPMRRFDRTAAQMVVIAAGLGLGIVEPDGAKGFCVVDQYKLGSTSP